MSDVSLLRMIENIYAAADGIRRKLRAALADEMQACVSPSDIVMFLSHPRGPPRERAPDLLAVGHRKASKTGRIQPYTGYYRRFDVWSPPMLKTPQWP